MEDASAPSTWPGFARRGASAFPRVESSATELPRVGPRSRAKGWAGRNGVTLRMPTSAS